VKSRPVLITFSILAALQVLTAGSALSDVLGKDVAGLIILGIAAVQVGMTFYVQNAIVPLEDSVAYINKGGVAVAGPAAGLTNGTAVEVQQAHVNTGKGQIAAPRAP
jgi:hypothetical protein